MRTQAPLVLALAPALLIVGGMLVMSFSGVAPARVELRDGKVRITLRGLMPIYALRRRLVVPLQDIETVHADRYAKNLIGGFRIGTHLPKVMTAGTFLRGGGRGRDFFAVYRAASALVLDIRPEARTYRRVIVEIDDLDATASAIDSARSTAR
ncbi:MAG: hypothetical protein M3Q68_01485 [Actinomycetota bacterium]|nr:hypothetical protein [Actinomycetota bacterium]